MVSSDLFTNRYNKCFETFFLKPPRWSSDAITDMSALVTLLSFPEPLSVDVYTSFRTCTGCLVARHTYITNGMSIYAFRILEHLGRKRKTLFTSHIKNVIKVTYLALFLKNMRWVPIVHY